MRVFITGLEAQQTRIKRCRTIYRSFAVYADGECIVLLHAEGKLIENVREPLSIEKGRERGTFCDT